MKTGIRKCIEPDNILEGMAAAICQYPQYRPRNNALRKAYCSSPRYHHYRPRDPRSDGPVEVADAYFEVLYNLYTVSMPFIKTETYMHISFFSLSLTQSHLF